MQCAAFLFFFHAGTKCQLTKSICAPPSSPPPEWGGDGELADRREGVKKVAKMLPLKRAAGEEVGRGACLSEAGGFNRTESYFFSISCADCDRGFEYHILDST